VTLEKFLDKLPLAASRKETRVKSKFIARVEFIDYLCKKKEK